MDPNRQQWNRRQQELRAALRRPEDHPQAVALFLRQHAAVHPAEASGPGQFSFDDEIWNGLDEAAARRVPPRKEHSIAWIFWHLTRIEDVTMNVLVAGGAQLLNQDGWLRRLQVTDRSTGNAMSDAELQLLSSQIDLPALRLYRLAVSRRTREIVQALSPDDVRRPVDRGRLQRLVDEGAVIPAASGLLDYWGGLTVAGLLLMPPTRHTFIHLNEARQLKDRLRKAA